MSFGSPYFTLPKFKLLKANSLEEALELLHNYSSEARIKAGGVGLLAFMKERLISPQYVISISSVKELGTFGFNKDRFEIGASVHLSALENDQIKSSFPTLYKAVKSIADPQIRNMGTLVGDVAEAIPWADAPTALASLEAYAVVSRKGSERTISIKDLIVGLGQISIDEDEMITKIVIPSKRTKGTYLKFSNGSEYGLATVALTYFPDERRFNLAFGSIAEKPIIVNNKEVEWEFEQENAINVKRLKQYIDEQINPMSDLLASSEFRKNIIKVLALQAVKEVLG